MNRGYIKFFRKFNEWEWKTKPNTVALFVHLLLTANHTEKSWRGITVKAGQCITGRRILAEKTGLTEQQIKTAFSHLQSTSDVTIKTTSKYSIITITNWEKYQDTNQQNNQQPTNNQPTDNQQPTNNQPHLKNDKNDKNDKNEEEIKEKKLKQKKEKISLDDLRVEHIAPWLQKKRQERIYLDVDEHRLLEIFRNWCKSKGKTYQDYVAAYRNAFEWKNIPKRTFNAVNEDIYKEIFDGCN